MSFESTNLMSIAKVVTGKHDANHADENGQYRFYTCASEFSKCNTYNFQGECIILPGNGANVGDAYFYDGKFDAYQRTYVVHDIDKKRIIPKFLHYNFLHNWKTIGTAQQFGSATNYIKIGNFENYRVACPSINIQRNAISELDLLAGIIDKQKQQLKELDTLAQSIFYDMFGNPVENDKGWEKKQIGKICTSKKQIQRASKRFKDSDIIRYIDISSIDNINNVMTSTTSYGFGDAPSRAQQVVEIGDVLISLVRPNLNNVAMVSEDGTDLVASSGFCVLRANCEIVKEFLFYSVKMKCFTDYLMQRVSGANYPAVREDDIMGYNIILPPLELQESFAQKIQSIESQKQSINRSIAESQKLFDYTMDKYFG